MRSLPNITNTLKQILLFLIFFSLITACSNKPHDFQKHSKDFAIEVETYKIKPADKKITISAAGELSSPQTSVITSDIMGKITYLNIPEGKEVNRGHILARIDDGTTKSEVKIAEAKLKNAEENHKRMEELKTEGAISQQTLDDAVERLDTAKGEVEKAQSEQTMTLITAPFNGYLSLRNVSLGAFIDPGDEIVRISQINPLDLVFSIPEQYTAEIKIGQKINFTVTNSQEIYNATVSVIDPYIDPDTRAIQIKASVQNSKREFLPGRFANVILELSNIQNAITIPQEAIIQQGAAKQVAIVSPENIVSIKEIKVNSWDNDTAFISEGLSEGDVIITSGHQKIHEGTKVIQSPYNPIHNKILDKDATN